MLSDPPFKYSVRSYPQRTTFDSIARTTGSFSLIPVHKWFLKPSCGVGCSSGQVRWTNQSWRSLNKTCRNKFKIAFWRCNRIWNYWWSLFTIQQPNPVLTSTARKTNPALRDFKCYTSTPSMRPTVIWRCLLNYERYRSILEALRKGWTEDSRLDITISDLNHEFLTFVRQQCSDLTFTPRACNTSNK